MRSIRLIVVPAILLGVVFVSFGGSSRASSSPAAVTFNKDVAPIFYKNCATCHRPGEIAPMSLMSFKDARALGQVDSRKSRRGHDAALARRSPTRQL
jgi:hypothetical protein